MRQHWLVLTILCLGVMWYAGVSAQQVPTSKKGKTLVIKAETPDSKIPIKTWEVKSWGETSDSAEKRAFEKARKEIDTFLQNLQPPLVWNPPRDDEFMGNYFVDSPRLCPDESKMVDGKLVQCWSWTVALSASQLDIIRREDANLRAEEARRIRAAVAEARMLVLGELVVSFVIVLGGLWLAARFLRNNHPK